MGNSKIITQRWLFTWVVFIMVTLPLPRHLVPDFGSWTQPLFKAFYQWIATSLFQLKGQINPSLDSDSTGMYIHFLVSFFICLVPVLIWTKYQNNKIPSSPYPLLQIICAYFLALELMSYGFAKLFMRQFYPPEANILFTEMGKLSPDIIYWSSMGSSPLFNYITGALEILAGLLLLFARTRQAGAYLSLAIMAQVVIINLSFDISVKLFSMFLFLLALIIIWPAWKSLLALFLGKKKIPPPVFISKIRPKKFIYYPLKAFIVTLIYLEALFPFVIETPRPHPSAHLAGAWRVESSNKNDSSVIGSGINRIFFHQHGYFIVQYEDGKMKDFEIKIGKDTTLLLLMNPESGRRSMLKTSPVRDNTNNLHITGILENDSIDFHAHRISLDSLPARKHGFHWTSDALD